MRGHPVSLFPFLGVLISAMGVLAFLAVTFMLFTTGQTEQTQAKVPVEVQWVGAPPHVRPVLMEILEDEVVLHLALGKEYQQFPLRDLVEEVRIVRALVDEGLQRIGPAASRYQLWLFIKSALPNLRPLNNSLTLALHELELANLNAEGTERETRYPILLVYPKGAKIYELASYLVESTTQLSMGLEPMLPGWELPYQDNAL